MRSSFAKRAVFMLLVTVLAAAAGSAGVLAWRTFNPPPVQVSGPRGVAATAPVPVPAPLPTGLAVGEQRPEFSLPDTDGVMRSVSEWDGKLLVINFWATWCPPCLEEIPAFVRLQDRYREQGVQFVGIALDSVENVREFMAEHAMNYPSLPGQGDAIELGKRYGNTVGALPYTVAVSRQGKVLLTHYGLFDEAMAKALIEENL
jgi:peroxiredoxin